MCETKEEVCFYHPRKPKQSPLYRLVERFSGPSWWLRSEKANAYQLKKLSDLGEDVESLLTLEAKPCSGEGDESIVRGAWDFKRINRLHEEYLLLLQNPPVRKSGKAPDPGVVQQWALKERLAWQAALKLDPLLPSKLLPPGYLGREVWSLRNAVPRDAGKWL